MVSKEHVKLPSWITLSGIWRHIKDVYTIAGERADHRINLPTIPQNLKLMKANDRIQLAMFSGKKLQ